ncbi:MAG: hypothetical protein HF308_20320, partial [Ignavibacteria bacterium]|nr:hypothetical protein [Ignavibacteria bacterium]
MTEIIEVPTTTNTTSKLQALINKTGNISAKYIFPAMKITVDVPLTYYNNTEFAGSGINSTIFKLMKDAPTTIFKEGTPLLAPKNPTAAENIIIHDIAFDGTRDSQAYVKKLYNKPWGHGYHNILMLGVFGNPAYTNTKNCKLYNLSFKDSLGDGIRAEGIYNVTIHDIYGERVGHDLICLVADTASVYKVKAKIDVNAGIRTRSARNVKMWDCEIDGSGGTAYSPGFEVQSTASNWKSYNIEIWNCYVHDTFGPGVQIIGTVPNNSDIQIHHCVFENCGEMPPANKLPYVGGVVFDGFNNIKIYSNDFIGCLGNSVSNAKYDIAGSMSGLTAEVYNN